jgi:hypothetical protein
MPQIKIIGASVMRAADGCDGDGDGAGEGNAAISASM